MEGIGKEFCHGCDQLKLWPQEFSKTRHGYTKRCTECGNKEEADLYYFVRNNDGAKTSDEYKYTHKVHGVKVTESRRYTMTAKSKCADCGAWLNIINEYSKNSGNKTGFSKVCKECNNPNYPTHNLTYSLSYSQAPCEADPDILRVVEDKANAHYWPAATLSKMWREGKYFWSGKIRRDVYEQVVANQGDHYWPLLQVFDLIPKQRDPTIYKPNSYRLNVALRCKKCNSEGTTTVKIIVFEYEDKSVSRGEGRPRLLSFMPDILGKEDAERGGFHFQCSHCDVNFKKRCPELDKYFFNKNGRDGEWKRSVIDDTETEPKLDVLDPLPGEDASSHSEGQEDLADTSIPFIDLHRSNHHLMRVDGGIFIAGNGSGGWLVDIAQLQGLNARRITDMSNIF